ncbi:TonB-dependent receptor [Spirosoma sp.]|nr:TonB-dependent receptor [Spirosoma sp.]MBN8820909.1 TonB-dependent receptor [Spirosoma sp.]OJW75925.1 MAG: SusC/RagA family TonB-linked outer membrane protein [Spirosoma sp. 48-14]
MKLSVIQLLITILFMGATYAHHAHGQEVLNQRITLKTEKTNLKKALVTLERSTEVLFVYNPREIPVNQKVTLDSRYATLKEALNELLTPLNIRYEVAGKQIILFKNDGQSASPSVSPLNPAELLADLTISGTVTDEKGEGLPGVSVLVKGTQRGTSTNTEGKYQIAVPDESAVLVFSFVGFQTQELMVEKRSRIDITLKTDNKNLDEVVVVGYGTVKKSDLTGAVAKVGEANIKATPIPSLDRAMQGRAAGVQVITNSARPGGSATIRIRGSGSVNASNDPLYVIDGFPTGNLNSINTDDIESIEVLKDASATAIYGSRGSNGVVLVTTKRGKAGKTVISYDGYYGVQSVRRTIPLLNAQQFADFVNEARVNGGAKPYFDGSTADQPLPTTLGAGTDWQSLIFQKAPIQSHQISASGGSDKSRYAVSFGYYDQQGIILNSNFKRYTLRANLDNNLTSRLKAGLTMQGAFTTGNNAKTEVDGNNGGGVTSAALSYAPNFPVYNADGSYYKNTGALNGYGVDNPLAVANEITNTATTIRLLANSFLDYTIIDGLNFRASFGADLQNTKTNYYATRLTTAGATLGGSASVGNTQSIGWLNENTLNYTRQLAPRHSLNALLGYTIQGLAIETVGANANTFSDDFAEFNNLGAGSSLVAPSSGSSDWRLISYIARVNYGFDDRFLLTLTGRRDGSSRFGPNRKFGFFPSGALAWKLANEKWMKNMTAISDAKLRLSYGLSGNQEIGNYQYLANISSNAYILGGALNTGAATAGVANPDLRWEKNAQFDAGVDFGLLNNRIQVTADYYIKTTSDLLFRVGIPTSSGFSTTLKNIGSVQNKGFELSLNTINVDRGGFRWTSEFNITFNQNKILTLDGRQQFTTGTDAQIFNTTVNPILLKVGSPLGNFYGRVTDGIFQNQAEIDASAQKGSAKPGDIRYKDLNGDGVINDNDRDIIGNSNPKSFGGFNNTFSYKGFDLNVFVQGTYGNQILNYGNFDLLNLTGGNNQSARVLDRWTPTNPSNEIPRANSAGGSRILSSFQVEDGSYLRVKNISLGYTIPKTLLSRLSMTSARIYVTAQNWFTITKYSGYDPEVNRYGSSSLSQGLDYGAYPAAKTVLVGLNLKF